MDQHSALQIEYVVIDIQDANISVLTPEELALMGGGECVVNSI